MNQGQPRFPDAVAYVWLWYSKNYFFCRYFFLFHTLDLSIAANAFISNSIWRLFSSTNLLNWHNFLHSHFKRISNFDGTQCAHCTITEGHWIFGADFVCFFSCCIEMESGVILAHLNGEFMIIWTLNWRRVENGQMYPNLSERMAFLIRKIR